MPTSGSASTDLIERARRHDPIAWQQLCQIYGPLVYRWARRAGLQDCDAGDIGQEVFRVVATRLGEYRHDPPGATFRGWLWTITHHKLGDFLRLRAQRPGPPGGTDAQQQLHELPALPAELSNPSHPPASDAETALRIAESVRGDFDPATWQAFWRMAIDGASAATAAGELGLSVAAARQAKYRVLKRIREEIER